MLRPRRNVHTMRLSGRQLRIFRATDGYAAAMWPVLGTSTLISIAFMRKRDLSKEGAPG
jgi:hypothetical protein